MRQQVKAIIINGYELPAFDEGCVFKDSTYGKFNRNANNELVGHKTGKRPLKKIENLQWSELPVKQWAEIINALDPFFVMVTFTTDTNGRITLKMYPSDRQATPSRYNDETQEYECVKNAKFNLIDCGY